MVAERGRFRVEAAAASCAQNCASRATFRGCRRARNEIVVGDFFHVAWKNRSSAKLPPSGFARRLTPARAVDANPARGSRSGARGSPLRASQRRAR